MPPTSTLPPRLVWITAAHWLVAAAAVSIALAFAPARYDLPPSGLPLALCVLAGFGVAAWRWLPAHAPVVRFGPANAITLARAAGVALFAAFVADPAALSRAGWLPFAVGAVLLALDGVDGWAARRSHTASAFGARLDMEVDAAFLVVLSVLVWRLDLAGPWVLGVGALRYAWVAASWFAPALARPLPDRYSRKVVCVVQGMVLVACLSPVVGPPVSSALCAAALASLCWSFAVDARVLCHAAARP